jgi:hypothetical protein
MTDTRPDLIERAAVPFMPSEQLPVERACPWWHGAAVAAPGSRVLIGLSKRCSPPGWFWCRLVARMGDEASGGHERPVRLRGATR